MKKVIVDWFTEVDNKTFDVTKALAVVSLANANFLAAYSVVVLHNAFDIQVYGLGVAALFTGVGVALNMKKESNVKSDD